MVILYTYKDGVYYNLNNISLEEMNEKGIKNNIYVNLTNRCPCSCTFCLRQTKEMTEQNSLWLKREPSVDEVIAEFEKLDISKYNEVIFCGFGEPTERLDDVILIAKYLKKRRNKILIRINSNGLSDLVNKKETAPLFKGLVDTMSISLNASNAEEYYRLTRSKFGIKSYEEMQKFAVSCKKYIPNVVFTVVDCIGEDEIKACQKVCDNLGVTLRVRAFEAN
ncbi:MAG: TIGR04100 family radical SAM protein [Clostridium sp.]|nr:TIGR04100 family radical SAM protein [Clostridium sp.]